MATDIGAAQIPGTLKIASRVSFSNVAISATDHKLSIRGTEGTLSRVYGHGTAFVAFEELASASKESTFARFVLLRDPDRLSLCVQPHSIQFGAYNPGRRAFLFAGATAKLPQCHSIPE